LEGIYTLLAPVYQTELRRREPAGPPPAELGKAA